LCCAKSSDNDWVVNWKTAWVERGGIRLCVHHAGDGPPVLMLHGITDNGRCWGRLADAFVARGHRVICPDQRGHGESDAPAHGYATQDYVDDALAVLNTYAVDRALVLGHSFGGRIAFNLAAHAPERVSRLILLDPSVREAPGVASPAQIVAHRYDFFAWLRTDQALPLDALIARQRAAAPDWREDEVRHWALAKHQASPRLWADPGIEWLPDWRGPLSRVRAPTLLVRGESHLGGIVPLGAIAELRGFGLELAVVTIAGAGHDLHRDHFDALWRVVAP
jgi:N-formylmaleamate deformylase